MTDRQTDSQTDRDNDKQTDKDRDRESDTYTDSVCDIVDVICGNAEWNYELLALVVQPLTQRVPAHEELHT